MDSEPESAFDDDRARDYTLLAAARLAFLDADYHTGKPIDVDKRQRLRARLANWLRLTEPFTEAEALGAILRYPHGQWFPRCTKS